MKRVDQAFAPLKNGTIRVIAKDSEGNQEVYESESGKECCEIMESILQ